MRKTVQIRYTLIPFLYTLFYNVNTNGGTVARSLIHEFPTDKGTYNIDEQFLWGSGLLISPVLYPSRTSIQAYFPFEARWYDYYTGKEMSAGLKTISAPRDFIPLHVRGGHIIPTQEPGANTNESRTKPFGLIIAPDKTEKATGSLYWDDGESFDSIQSRRFSYFEFSYYQLNAETVIEIKAKSLGYSLSNKLNKIRLFDVRLRPTQVLIDSAIQHSSFSWNSVNEDLELTNLNLSLNEDHNILIKYL